MTPVDFKQHRRALGLSAEGMARVVGVASGRTIRRWESGEQNIPPPVVVLITVIMRSKEVRDDLGLTLKKVAAPRTENKSIPEPKSRKSRT